MYFPEGIPNIQRTMALWSTLVENCLNKEEYVFSVTWQHFLGVYQGIIRI